MKLKKPYVLTYIVDGVKHRFKFKEKAAANENFEKLSSVLKNGKGIITLHYDGVLIRQKENIL